MTIHNSLTLAIIQSLPYSYPPDTARLIALSSAFRLATFLSRKTATIALRPHKQAVWKGVIWNIPVLSVSV